MRFCGLRHHRTAQFAMHINSITFGSFHDIAKNRWLSVRIRLTLLADEIMFLSANVKKQCMKIVASIYSVV